jgi:hypothetical protein
MKHPFAPTADVARLIERVAGAARFLGEMGKAKTSTEAFALSIVRADEPILRNTGCAGAKCRNCAISP